MLKNWQIGHFKSIDKTRDLGLADITVLTGLHHAGKTNLLQSILLIAQTLSSYPVDRTLLPNGSFTQLGALNEIASDTSRHSTLTFGFELLLPQRKAETVHTPGHSAGKVHSSTTGQYSIKVTVNFNLDDVHKGLSLSSFDRTRMSELPSEQYVHMRKPSKSQSPAIESCEITLSGSEASNETIVFAARKLSEQEISRPYNHFRNRYHLLSYFSDSLSHEGTLSVNGRQAPYAYQMLFRHFLPGQLLPKMEWDRSSRHQPPDPALHYAQQVEEAVKQSADFFGNQVRYLGPKRVTSPTTSMAVYRKNFELYDVGPQGEYAAAIYSVQRATTITWYNPTNQAAENGTLEEAINYWLQYLEVAYSVQCKKMGLDSLDWQVAYQKDQQPRPLAGHSYALNQVLPLLVMGLLAPIGSLLLIEQPELFLHQRAQARLGDFFVGLAMCHKQCLIDTQSEYLVTQLRYHIVRDGRHDPDKYKIYFAEQDEEGSTQFTPIEISPRGNILNWPEGFFDETSLQEEQISIAYLRRNAKSGKQEQPR